MRQNNIWLWYDFWFSCQIWLFRIFQFSDIFYQTFTSKTASLKHAPDKVLRAKWPHGMYGNIMFSSKSGLFNWICYWNLEFYPTPLLRFLCLINSFYRRYVSCIYNIYPIYQIYPIYPIYARYCLTISYYFALLCAFVRYCALLWAISLYFALFRKSLVTQKGHYGIHIIRTPRN